MANIRLLIVDPDVNFRTDLRKQLQRAGIDVVGEAEYGADAASMMAAERPDAIAIAWQDPTARAEQTLEATSQSFPSAPIIAYSDAEDIKSVRRAVQAGAHDYITKPFSTKEFVDSLKKAVARIERQHFGDANGGSGARGIVISLFGAKGGIGKTTLATNLSVALAQLRNESVALMDIDTRFGDVALVLDAETETNIADAVAQIEDIDRSTIRSYLFRHASGVNVLAAPNRPAEWRQVQPMHIERLIELLRETHDYVILDTPGFFTELVGTALDMSDLVLLVTTLDVSSIKDSAMAVDMLAQADFPMDRVKLLLNHPSDVHRVDIKQVTSVTGLDVFWDVPYDRNVVTAGQVGTPMVLSKPNSKGARSIIDLAVTISGGKRERSFFRRQTTPAPREEFVAATVEGGGE